MSAKRTDLSLIHIFAPIAAALKEIGYKGWFTLEADHYLKEKFNAENVFEGDVYKRQLDTLVVHTVNDDY